MPSGTPPEDATEVDPPRGEAPSCPDGEPPTRIGEFEIVDTLGEGAFGVVFLARQLSLGREVALKVHRRRATTDASTRSPSEAGDASRPGQSEGKLLASLEHDHIVKVYSELHDPVTGSTGLCLQYVPGANLRAVIRLVHASDVAPTSGEAIVRALDASRRGESTFDPIALRDRETLLSDDFPQAVARIGARLAEALACAHGRGILHCDIKPANILLTPYGRPMLADFNVAFDRERHADATELGGTLAYMAPEHAAAMRGDPSGRVDERCDIYSLGLVLHELATGARPGRKTARGAEPVARVPRELAAVIRRCLEHDPDARYPTAEHLGRALDGAWRLLATRRTLPRAGALARWAVDNRFRAMVLAALCPHIAASAVNISYDAVAVELEPRQRGVFALLVLGYNAIAYPLCFGSGIYLLLKVRAGLTALETAQGPDVDLLRARVIRLGWQMAILGAVGWLPGALAFPLVIDLAAGPVGWRTYAHYAISFLLAGLVGVVFGYLSLAYVVFRAVLPYVGNPDTTRPGRMWEEVRRLTVPFGPLLVLACTVPLIGAALLVTLGDDRMTLGFRLLVTALIVVGMVGVGVAERLTRALRSLAAPWQRGGEA
jgi:eukaryotic-like serine/threonine-protein kinase